MPLHVLKDKLDVYIAEGHIAADEKDHYAQVVEKMLGNSEEPTCMAHPTLQELQQQRSRTKKTAK